MTLDEVTARMGEVREAMRDLDADINALQDRKAALAAEYERLYGEANRLYTATLAGDDR